MNAIEIALQTERVAEAIMGHVKGVADTLKEFVAREIEAAEERITEKFRRALEELEARVLEKHANISNETRMPRVQYPDADAGSLGELAGTARNLERRAGRHAEHLLKLESRVRTLEGRKNYETGS